MRRLGLAALVVVMAGCPHQFYMVHGTVVDCRTNQPIADAVVDLRYPGEHGQNRSEANGEFGVAVNDLPNDREGTLQVSAPAYRSETRKVHDGDRLIVCLHEDAAAGE